MSSQPHNPVIALITYVLLTVILLSLLIGGTLWSVRWMVGQF